MPAEVQSLNAYDLTVPDLEAALQPKGASLAFLDPQPPRPPPLQKLSTPKLQRSLRFLRLRCPSRTPEIASDFRDLHLGGVLTQPPPRGLILGNGPPAVPMLMGLSGGLCCFLFGRYLRWCQILSC